MQEFLLICIQEFLLGLLQEFYLGFLKYSSGSFLGHTSRSSFCRSSKSSSGILQGVPPRTSSNTPRGVTAWAHAWFLLELLQIFSLRLHSPDWSPSKNPLGIYFHIFRISLRDCFSNIFRDFFRTCFCNRPGIQFKISLGFPFEFSTIILSESHLGNPSNVPRRILLRLQ